MHDVQEDFSTLTTYLAFVIMMRTVAMLASIVLGILHALPHTLLFQRQTRGSEGVLEVTDRATKWETLDC